MLAWGVVVVFVVGGRSEESGEVCGAGVMGVLL
jgi:hypothetical protein